MWGKLAQLFFRRPDLVLAHLDAYALQAGREWRNAKKNWSAALLGLLIGAFLLVLALALLAFAVMLDTALPVFGFMVPRPHCCCWRWRCWRYRGGHCSATAAKANSSAKPRLILRCCALWQKRKTKVRPWMKSPKTAKPFAIF